MNKSFMTFLCTKWAMPTIAAKARALGFEGVELRVDAGHAHGLDADSPSAQVRQTRRIFADAGVKVCCLATSCRFAMSDGAERWRQIERLLKYFDLAEALGVPVIRVFGGMPSPGADHAAGKRHVIAALREVARRVAGRPVTAALETHDDYSRGVEVADVLRKVDSPHVQANYDLMHPVRAREPLRTTLKALQGRVVHSHLHDGKIGEGRLELRPIGQGDVPHVEPIRRLLADGYQGFFSLEYIGPEWDQPDRLLPEFMEQLRRLEEQV